MHSRSAERSAPQQTVRDLLLAGAERNSVAPALIATDGSIMSYARLLERVDATAADIRSFDVRPDDRIALVLPNGIAAAVAFLAGVTAGIACPLSAGCRRAEFDFFFNELQTRTLITDPSLDSPASAVARSRGMRILDIAELGTGPTALPRDEHAKPGVALLLHTSGTTAKPKTVALTHANLYISATNIATWLVLTPGDRCHNVMPLFHIHGLVAAILASLSAGASVVCSTGFEAPRFFAQLRTHQPTWYTAVPTMHQSILGRAPDEPPPLPLRFVRSASGPLPPQTARGLANLFGAPVVEAYGMTEAAHQICSNPLGAGRQRDGSVGPAAGSDVAILDERGDPVTQGRIGEVAIRGANVTEGYVGDPAANARAFVHGWLRTGDLGRIDHDGYLFLESRIKELINRGGEKVSPREIDDVLMKHPSVVQAAAFGMPDERLGEEVGAVVVLAPKATTDERTLMLFAAEHLADWKVPRRIAIVDELPKGPTGKLARTGLAAALGLDLADCALERRQPIRASGFEEVLAEIWCEVLRVEAVDPEADFLALGGDSVLAAQIIARVRKRCGRELSIVAFFDRPTLAAMAVSVAQAPSLETP